MGLFGKEKTSDAGKQSAEVKAAGPKQNDLASLYWFDKAVDNGAADLAQKDRDGILNAYRTNLSPQ